MPDPSPSPDDLRALRAAATDKARAALIERVYGRPMPYEKVQPEVLLLIVQDVEAVFDAVGLLPLLDRAEAAEARVRLTEGALYRCCHDSFSDGDGAYQNYLADAEIALTELDELRGTGR